MKDDTIEINMLGNKKINVPISRITNHTESLKLLVESSEVKAVSFSPNDMESFPSTILILNQNEHSLNEALNEITLLLEKNKILRLEIEKIQKMKWYEKLIRKFLFPKYMQLLNILAAKEIKSL